MDNKVLYLPGLREDLQILEGPKQEDGSDGWVVYDPLRNRYFSLGFKGLRLIRAWKKNCEVNAFIRYVSDYFSLDVSKGEVEGFVHFLQINELVLVEDKVGLDSLIRKGMVEKNWLSWIIHNYLFIKIPLFRPDELLDRTVPWINNFLDRRIIILIRVLGIIGVFLVIRQWEEFKSTFLYFFSWDGFAFYLITLLFIKSGHELGHAFAAKRRGCKVSSMGVAFLVLFPVLYTDTTDAWRLKNHRERLAIVIAGIKVEVHIAMLATFCWSFFPDGLARSAAFFIATTSWITSLAVNLSPFMRFDGYYFLSDWLKAENLQPRAFAMGRWGLREWLFGFKENPPENLSTVRKRIFIGYAWCTWIYRFFLFLGIAVLVYYFVFKALGIILFLVEIIWFILLPIYSEVLQWYRRRANISWNSCTARTVFLLFSLFILISVPWTNSLAFQAVIVPHKMIDIYPPESSVITHVNVNPGDQVQAGDVLFVLDSPVLKKEYQLLLQQIMLKKKLLKRQVGADANRASLEIIKQQIGELSSRLSGIHLKIQRLTIIAPYSGRITRIADLHDGIWISKNKPIAVLASDTEIKIHAMIPEDLLNKIALGAKALFIPSTGDMGKINISVSSIDKTAVIELPYPAMASIYGGEIPVRTLNNGEDSLYPKQAYYRVVLNPIEELSMPSWHIDGVVHIEGDSVSWLQKVITGFGALLIRESGF